MINSGPFWRIMHIGDFSGNGGQVISGLLAWHFMKITFNAKPMISQLIAHVFLIMLL